MQEDGHHVKINKLEVVDDSDIIEEFRVVDKTERDITNRGINQSMSLNDKLSRFMEVKEVPIELREIHMEVAKEIIDSVEEG